MTTLLDEHLQLLRAEGYIVERTDEGMPPQSRHFVVLKEYSIPSGWSVERVDLLVIVPGLYPTAQLDMFWIKPALRLPDGRMPQGAEVTEQYLGELWQRFSWHPQRWRPGRDTICTYLDEVVNARLHTRK